MTAWRRLGGFAALAACMGAFCSPYVEAGEGASVVTTQVKLVSIYPHNTSAFTEGFLYLDGALVESTGLARHSVIREYRLQDAVNMDTISTYEEDGDSQNGEDDDEDVEPSTKKGVVNEFHYDPEIFGEGIASIGDKIYALTYKHNKVLVLSRKTFKLLETHPFRTSTGEGWGMTTDDKYLIVSDGSSSIQFFDPSQNFKRVRSIDVKENGNLVSKINELEYVDGEILANVWFENCVLRINPEDGTVIERIDLSWIAGMVSNLDSMQDQHMREEAVMNGIAYDPASRHIFLTGKLWDSIFEVELSYLAKEHHKSDT
ncbi:hypothetical protein Poli38472_000696 [Pythium oligandrum]|uniref:Glutamine cyclotransferase n=1 Tax=Pythium oligandrum TaxID=41045 RepID=A0A8K1CC40_PYTOL|nr:hypothetical protein Poli38472_000696 [Pythium oligandrum]|eukprot:TMW60654.1 hypothetical protein Poli38472_000696 [Pythium oligandrum]